MSGKKITTYVAASPRQIVRAEDKRDFREFLKWLQQVTHVIHWTVDPVWWFPRPEQERGYNAELDIIHSADLVIAFYPTEEGALRREVGVIERLVIGAPLIGAVHKSVTPSKFLTEMYQRYTTHPFVFFDKFTDLQGTVEERLNELSSV